MFELQTGLLSDVCPGSSLSVIMSSSRLGTGGTDCKSGDATYINQSLSMHSLLMHPPTSQGRAMQHLWVSVILLKIHGQRY